jgi:hypothetical protein
MIKSLFVGGLLAATALPAQPRQSDTFTWSGKIPAGRWIRIRNLNGEISVGPATGDRVEVTATKRWRRSDPADVKFDVKKFGPGDESVVVCALWFDNTSCDDRSYETRGSRRRRDDSDNDLVVEFRVLVPKGVKVGVNTVNGALSIEGTSAEVDAVTVNGGIDIAADVGPVNAETTNGRVRARVARVEAGDLNFATVNGGVLVEFAGDLNGDVELGTVNGGVSTDYPITVSGRLDPRHLRAHVGKSGGPRIRLSTVNGSVTLRRR